MKASNRLVELEVCLVDLEYVNHGVLRLAGLHVHLAWVVSDLLGLHVYLMKLRHAPRDGHLSQSSFMCLLYYGQSSY